MNGRRAGAFAGILHKEFRENYKLAILLLLIVSAVLTADLQQMAKTGSFYEISLFSIFNAMSMLTASIGLLIGLAQVVFESRGDKWSFLIHRPVRRSTLFWGKAVAGILLYTTAVAIPWLSSLIWLSIPGHVALPFDSRMALPGAADLLCGVVYYFAGLLTGMREARWYASRTLGIGVGIVCSIATYAAGSFWWAVAFIAGLLLTGGGGDSQPPHYTVDSDGSIVRLVFAEGRIVDIQDQQGRPIEKYRDPAARDGSARGVVERDMGISYFQNGVVPNSFRSTREYFLTLYPDDTDVTIGPVRWYYVTRERLIAAYDNKTAQLIGWLGPDGFTAGSVPPQHRFDHPLLNKNSSIQPLITFEDAVYRLDLGQRHIERIFVPAAGEAVLGAQGANSYEVSGYVSGARAGFDSIVTTQRVVLQSHDGTIEMSAPFEPRAVRYDRVAVYRALNAAEMPTFIWYSRNRMDRPEPASEFVTKFDAANAVVARYELPPLEMSASMPWSAAPVFLVFPVTVRAALARPWRGQNQKIDLSSGMSQDQRAVTWLLSGLVSLASAAAIFARCRRYAFASGRKWTWTAIGFILGPFGFLLMRVLLEWPLREKCPACGRMRVVSHEHCEHCSKPFAPPQADGTEVFEAL